MMDRLRLLLPGLFFLSLLPFVQRPFFFDDASFLAFAKGALNSPLRPYDFSMDLASPDQPVWKQGEPTEFTHPPLTGWALSLPLHLFGEKVVPLHLIIFFAAALILVAGGSLAVEFTQRPLLAVWFFAVSPAFFLTSLTFYAQMFYMLFYLLTIWAFRRLAGRARWLCVGFFLTLAAMSLHQWPVLFLILGFMSFLMKDSIDKPWRSAWIGTLVFLIFYGGWSLWETKTYGMPNLFSSYRVRAASTSNYPWRASFLPLVFMAASSPSVFFSWFFVVKRSKPLILSLGGLLLCNYLFFASPLGGFSIGQSMALAVFFATGVCFLISSWLFFKEGGQRDRCLVGWFFIEFAFLQKYLVYPSGHHLVMLSFPAILLSIRMAEICRINQRKVFWSGCVLSLFTLLLALSDYSQACIGPQVAKDQPAPGERSFYWGNVFGAYEYHLKKAGWKPYDKRVPPQPGDYVIVPVHINAQGPVTPLRQYPFSVIKKSSYYQKIPLRTCSMVHLAGWYSASWGVLPFVFATGPVEEFLLLRCGQQ